MVRNTITNEADRFFRSMLTISITGTIMATLTRKRKSVDFLPKYEMVTYCRTSSIPTSHIHMYDPDNMITACNIFRVSG